MTFAVYTRDEDEEEKLIETYQFSLEYPDSETFLVNGKDLSKENLKQQAVKLIRSLVEFSQTLDDLPNERWLTMKLLYYDDITPPNYEPKYFTKADLEDLQFPQEPLKIKIGQLSTPHHSLKIKFAGIDSLFEEEQEEGEDERNNTLLNGAGPEDIEENNVIKKDEALHEYGSEDEETVLENINKIALAEKTPNSPLDETKIINPAERFMNEHDDNIQNDPWYEKIKEQVLLTRTCGIGKYAKLFKLETVQVKEIFKRLCEDKILEKKGRNHQYRVIATSSMNINKEDGCEEDDPQQALKEVIQKGYDSDATELPEKQEIPSSSSKTENGVAEIKEQENQAENDVEMENIPDETSNTESKRKIQELAERQDCSISLSQVSNQVTEGKCSIVKDPIHQKPTKKMKIN